MILENLALLRTGLLIVIQHYKAITLKGRYIRHKMRPLRCSGFLCGSLGPGYPISLWKRPSAFVARETMWIVLGIRSRYVIGWFYCNVSVPGLAH